MQLGRAAAAAEGNGKTVSKLGGLVPPSGLLICSIHSSLALIRSRRHVWMTLVGHSGWNKTFHLNVHYSPDPRAQPATLDFREGERKGWKTYLQIQIDVLAGDFRGLHHGVLEVGHGADGAQAWTEAQRERQLLWGSGLAGAELVVKAVAGKGGGVGWGLVVPVVVLGAAIRF